MGGAKANGGGIGNRGGPCKAKSGVAERRAFKQKVSSKRKSPLDRAKELPDVHNGDRKRFKNP